MKNKHYYINHKAVIVFFFLINKKRKEREFVFTLIIMLMNLDPAGLFNKADNDGVLTILN